MRIELGRQSIDVQQQVPIKVYYEGETVGEFYADLWAGSRIIVELKAVQALLKEHEVQLVNYLTATKTETGLLINFGASVEVRRKFREYTPSIARGR